MDGDFWLFSLGIHFCDFQQVPDSELIIIDFVFIEYVQWKYMFFNNHNVLTLCSTSISLYAILFLNKRDKIVIDQT